MTKDSCNSKNNKNEKYNNLKKYWDKTYLKIPEEKLGWFQTDFNHLLKLISISGISKTSRILNVGAGSTKFIDELVKQNYSNLIATDISKIALEKIQKRLNLNNVEYIVDDLTNPCKLTDIKPVDLWIDRAVLHFFTEKEEQKAYFDLLNNIVKPNGFIILAEYNLTGAKQCAGLPIYRYSKEMLVKSLGADFKLIDSFDYTFIMPSGSERPYIYTLFKKTR